MSKAEPAPGLPAQDKPSCSTTKTRHPAKFSNAVLAEILTLSAKWNLGRTVLDPFAGTGKIHALRQWGFLTAGLELEPEWAAMSPYTRVGDALATGFPDNAWTTIVTSPTYGNRMADHYNVQDASRRNTYQTALGRDLHPDNSGRLQWGPAYRDFHTKAWTEARRILVPDGHLVLNISDHIRNREYMPVTQWHVDCLCGLGFGVLDWRTVETPRLRYGQNHAARIDHESVILFLKID